MKGSFDKHPLAHHNMKANKPFGCLRSKEKWNQKQSPNENYKVYNHMGKIVLVV